MIIECGYPSVVEAKFDYQGTKVLVFVQNISSESYELIAEIEQLDGRWPEFEEMRKLVAKKLNHKPLARYICTHLGWELGTVPRGMEPGWESPMERGSGWIQTTLRGPANQAKSIGPLIQAVPQPPGLSDSQIKNAAKSVSSRLAACFEHNG